MIKIIIYIIFKIIKLITYSYLLFNLTAIISGEYLFKVASRNNMTFSLRAINLNSLCEPLGTRRMIYILHHNITFNYIYLRVSNFKIYKTFMNKEIIYKLFFIYFTGISWLFIKIVNKFLKIKSLDIKKIIFIETINSFSNKLLICENGKWEKNGFNRIIDKKIRTYLTETGISVKVQNIAIEEYYHTFEKHNKMFNNIDKTPMIFKSSKLKNEPYIGNHYTTEDLHKDIAKVALLTDEVKSIKNNYYESNLLINKIYLYKNTCIIDKCKENLITNDKEIWLPKKKIINNAIENGYNSEFLNDKTNYEIDITKIWNQEIIEWGIKYGLKEDIIDEINNLSIEELMNSPTK